MQHCPGSLFGQIDYHQESSNAHHGIGGIRKFCELIYGEDGVVRFSDGVGSFWTWKHRIGRQNAVGKLLSKFGHWKIK